jgi:hypothetical protein
MDDVGKTYVLDTATKGTGASVVPLERGAKPERGPVDRSEPQFPVVKNRPPEREPEARAPRTFRVVDVLTRETLADGADTRATLELLRGLRSIVDVHVSVHQPESDTWRLLSLAEHRALWDARERAPER